MKLVINKITEQIIAKTAANLPQSILLTGPVGIGLTEIAKHIANLKSIKPIIILPEKDEKVDLEKGIISVEIMRRLYDEVRTKTDANRMIIIDYTETMTTQAQNAFLKLLEEPMAGVYFILLSHTTTKLLPTILSRVEKINIRPVSIQQSNDILDELQITDATKRAQIMFIAPGLPAEIIRLCMDNEYFASRSSVIRDARELLRGTTYQKLLIAQRYKDNRANTLILLNDAAKMLQTSVSANPQIDSIKFIDRILNAYQQIEANGNIRLCLARIVL